MQHIPSYPSVYAIGHRAIPDLFKGPVVVQEKIDGSQFSFAKLEGELCCRSKGKDIIMDAPEKMFNKAIETVKAMDAVVGLRPGWVYRGEFLGSPKHNTLKYDRVPKNFIILYDISDTFEFYNTPEFVQEEAERLGLEVVPTLFTGEVKDAGMFKGFLEKTSILGGTLVEGVVAKNYSVFTQEKKAAMGKYVSEAFKETNQGDWKLRHPTQTDIETNLINQYRTPMRWSKAVQHLKELGLLKDSPEDIGALMKEVAADIEKECADEIKEQLYRHFGPKVVRGAAKGIPEWYKEQLLKKAFRVDVAEESGQVSEMKGQE